MRLIFFSFCIAIFLYACSSNPKQPTINTKYSILNFDTEFYDFGEVKNGDTVYHTFNFINKGSAPLVIYDISTSCGCTVANWTNKPVLPKQRGSVRIQFSKLNDLGLRKKIIVIKANTKDPYTVLKIFATIKK